MKKQLFFYVLFLVGFTSFSQEEKLVFPEDYLGVYKGDLEINSDRGNQKIGMEFHLLKTDDSQKYKYTIVYIFDGKRQERDYTLFVKDREKGRYVVDENNGILLDAQLFGATLYAMFEVDGTLLTTTERFYENAMDFEITATSRDKANKTIAEGEEATEVLSYPISTLQKAHLIKEK